MPEVESSAIRAVDYDPARATLTVVFVSGAVYAYAAVPPEVYEAFLAAESKGRRFMAHIRGRYAYRRMDDGAH
ncbi:MAG: KTSC domain-containing protein [Hyphomicrobiales bacterium]|nr:KTSC domain-containing protein [Hyphomicrobiales bacterium]